MTPALVKTWLDLSESMHARCQPFHVISCYFSLISLGNFYSLGMWILSQISYLRKLLVHLACPTESRRRSRHSLKARFTSDSGHSNGKHKLIKVFYRTWQLFYVWTFTFSWTCMYAGKPFCSTCVNPPPLDTQACEWLHDGVMRHAHADLLRIFTERETA